MSLLHLGWGIIFLVLSHTVCNKHSICSRIPWMWVWIPLSSKPIDFFFESLGKHWPLYSAYHTSVYGKTKKMLGQSNCEAFLKRLWTNKTWFYEQKNVIDIIITSGVRNSCFGFSIQRSQPICDKHSICSIMPQVWVRIPPKQLACGFFFMQDLGKH